MPSAAVAIAVAFVVIVVDNGIPLSTSHNVTKRLSSGRNST
jgi:hypothetical protein